MDQLTVRGQVQKSEQVGVKMADHLADGWSSVGSADPENYPTFSLPDWPLVPMMNQLKN
jgi:hypothetical protein